MNLLGSGNLYCGRKGVGTGSEVARKGVGTGSEVARKGVGRGSEVPSACVASFPQNCLMTVLGAREGSVEAGKLDKHTEIAKTKDKATESPRSS